MRDEKLELSHGDQIVSGGSSRQHGEDDLVFRPAAGDYATAHLTISKISGVCKLRKAGFIGPGMVTQIATQTYDPSCWA
jgi:hypothetical protein